MTEERNRVSTLIVMVSTLVSRLLGFIRIAVIGAVFGASGNADVLNLVFNIPNNLRKLLAEGALSSAFIPALSRCHVEDPTGRSATLLVRRLIGFQLLALFPVILVSVVAPHAVVDLILDFPEVQRQFLAGRLYRWFILYLVLISIAAVFMGTLNSHGHFIVPAIAPLWFSVSVIGAVWLLHDRLGVFSMVVGVLLGGVGQFVLQVPPMRARGYRLRPLFRFRSERFLKVLRQWGPVVSTASVFAVNQQVALYFASGLSDGAGSAMTNAIVFWQLPFGIFAASITTVLFPTMSRQFAQSDAVALARTIESGIRGILLLLVPAGVGLIVMGEEIIAVALQRGAFTTAATARAAFVLRYYSVGLFSVGAFTFLQRAYYACDDYRTPLFVAVITVVLDVALSVWLKETILEVAGLALANTIAFTVGFLLYLSPIRRYAPDISYRRILTSVVPAVTATIAAVLTVFIVRAIFSIAGVDPIWWTQGSTVSSFGYLAAEAIPALLTIAGVYRAFGLKLRSIRKGDT